MPELAMRGWYEIRGNNLIIWEGILAEFPQNLDFCKLFKIMDSEVFEIHVDLRLLNPKIDVVKSEGYWQCAEISGLLSTDSHFLCHSLSPQHSSQILKVLPSAIIEITIRFDPNPLRNWSKTEIKERIARWQQVMRNMCEFPGNSKMILDSNMLD